MTTGGGGLLEILQSKSVQDKLSIALPKHMTPDRFLRIATSAIQRTPKLLSCTQESVLSCLQDLSQLGLEPDGRRAYLIPYGNKCTLVIDYKGMVELVMRNGNVSTIHADAVCDNDRFIYDRGIVEEHKIDFKQPRGEWYAVYAMVKFKDGSQKFEVMTKDEVYKIRDKSAAWGAWLKYQKKGPWNDYEEEMGKKTAFKRLCKWVVMSPEIRDAIDIDDRGHQYSPELVKAVNDPLEAMKIARAGMEPEKPQEVIEAEPVAEAAEPDDMGYHQVQLQEAKTIRDVDGIEQDGFNTLDPDRHDVWKGHCDDRRIQINEAVKR
jgi:recombination protein RecT